jgi:hypothetical protein
VFETVVNYLDKFGPELLVIQFGFLVILSTLFLWLWFSNRRKYHNLKHAIPATVVKSYLDSIIQNSTALKSQLFRGGGLEASGIPSVMPLSQLSGGESLGVSGAPSTALLEELNQKRAIIASLESQLSASQTSQREIEAKLALSQAALAAAEAKIRELEALLAQARAGGDGALKAELAMVTKERDEIRDRLKEFEIISDDLANLKRLQQENEQLKRSLAAQGSAPAPAPAPEIRPPVDPNNILSQADVSDLLQDLGAPTPATASTDDNRALDGFLAPPAETIPSTPTQDDVDSMFAKAESAAALPPPGKGDNLNNDDLLSEFEKMLG